jgi:hypothetical protein
MGKIAAFQKKRQHNLFYNTYSISIQGAGRREKSKKGALWEVLLLFSRRWDPLTHKFSREQSTNYNDFVQNIFIILFLKVIL